MDRETGFVAAEFDRALNLWCIRLGDSQESARVRYVVRLLRERGVWTELTREWAAADERGDADAAWRMGWVLFDQGDQAGSERAFERAAERGNLAVLSEQLRQRRLAGQDTTKAEKRHRQAERRRQQADELADQHGDAQAAYRIGRRLLTQADAVESESSSLSHEQWVASYRELGDRERELRQAAKTALRRAVELGSADAAAELGGLAYHPPGDDDDPFTRKKRRKKALRWYRRADELGHPAGTWWLGELLDDLGDTDAAKAAFRRADARGNPHAASSLARLLRHHTPPDWDGAEAAYRHAAEIGYDENAWMWLARFLRERGDLRGVETAYRNAVEHNEPHAKPALRSFYEEHPDLKPTDS